MNPPDSFVQCGRIFAEALLENDAEKARALMTSALRDAIAVEWFLLYLSPSVTGCTRFHVDPPEPGPTGGSRRLRLRFRGDQAEYVEHDLVLALEPDPRGARVAYVDLVYVGTAGRSGGAER